MRLAHPQNPQAFWVPDVATLVLHILTFSTLSLVLLTWYVREKV